MQQFLIKVEDYPKTYISALQCSVSSNSSSSKLSGGVIPPAFQELTSSLLKGEKTKKKRNI